jgi:hypothetical protein
VGGASERPEDRSKASENTHLGADYLLVDFRENQVIPLSSGTRGVVFNLVP